MRKQNILDFLCDDFSNQFNKEKENLKSVLKDDEYNNLYHHINIFLTNNYKLFNLDFDYNINSSDMLEKSKSLYLLSKSVKGVLDLLSATPSFFKSYESKYGRSLAFDEVCFRVLLGNILDFKKELKKITEKDSQDIIDSMWRMIEILQTTKYVHYNEK